MLRTSPTFEEHKSVVGNGSPRSVAVRRAQQALRNPPLSSLSTSPFPRLVAVRGARARSTQFTPVVGLPNAWPGHLHVRGAKGAPLTSPLSSHSPSSFLRPSRLPLRLEPAFHSTRHAPSQQLGCLSHFGSAPRPLPLVNRFVHASLPSGSRLLLSRVSSPRLTIRSSSRPPPSRARRAAPPAPSFYRAASGRPSPVSSQVRRFAAALCSPIRTYHRVAAPRRPRRPLLSSKPLGHDL